MIRHAPLAYTYKRHEYVTLLKYLQWMLENEIAQPLEREVLYDFTVKLYKRSIDSPLRDKFRVVYHYKDALAFGKCYLAAAAGVLEAYETFQALDRHFNLLDVIKSEVLVAA